HSVEVRFDLGLHFSCVRPVAQTQSHASVEIGLVFRVRCVHDCGQVAEFIDHDGDLLASQAFEPGSVRKLPFGFGAFSCGGVDPFGDGGGIGSGVESGLVARELGEIGRAAGSGRVGGGGGAGAGGENVRGGGRD